MATAKKKWFLVVGKDYDWGYPPVEAESAAAAVEAVDEEALSSDAILYAHGYNVFELFGKEPTKLVTVATLAPRED